MVTLLKQILIIAAIIWVIAYMNFALLQQSAEKLTIRLRGMYLKSLLKQEVAFFEKNNVEQMPSDIGQYFTKINKGLGDSQGQLFQALGSFFGGMILAIIYGPVIALICFCFIPIFFIMIMLLKTPATTTSIAKMEAITKLGGYTEECLHSLKLIVSFAQEEHKIQEYNKRAKETYVISNKNGNVFAAYYFVARIGIFGFFVYSYYIASIFIEEQIQNPRTEKPYSIEEVVSVTQALIVSMFATFQLQTHI